MALDPETLEQLLETVQRFVAERLMPLEDRVAEEDAVPLDVVEEMRNLGLFGLSVPEAYGGLGLSMAEEVQVAFLLGGTSPAFRSIIGTNNGIGSQGIVMDGTEEQKRYWLPRLASGEIVSAFCLTEPEAGSDAGSLHTSARREGDDYIIRGTKRFITNGPHAELFTVFARTDPQSKDGRGVSAFLVEADRPGISRGRRDRKMGQQGTHTCDVIFDDVPVPAANIIGGEAKLGHGFKTAMKVLDRGRLHISAVCVGVAERLIAIPAIGVVIVVMIIYFFLGMVLDSAGMMALTVPIFFPIVTALGVDPLWFGILVVRAMEVAMITPPIGITVYVMSGIAPDIPLQKIFKGIVPFVIADIFHIALLMLFPAIVLFLPNL